jgi:hypothetical protein
MRRVKLDHTHVSGERRHQHVEQEKLTDPAHTTTLAKIWGSVASG